MNVLVKILIAALLSAVSCQQKCLKVPHHKTSPSAESGFQECTLYSESSCCHANVTEKLSRSPVVEVDNYYWNRCGNLSKTCEDYMKKLECFYQCSPLAAHWVHPNSSEAVQNIPLCQSFCDNWFDACRSDQICAYNWLTDWIIDESGNHCKNECIPFSKMYVNGTDLCQNSWGISFVVSSSPCRCLDMSETDKQVVKYILEDDNSEESGEQEACKPRLHKPQDKAQEQKDD
ncbi:hypothetical protein FKM82_002014 [Ascaphus truei]